MQSAEFAQLAIGFEAGVGGGKVDHGEGGPEIFAETCGDGLFAEEGELVEGLFVLLRGEVRFFRQERGEGGAYVEMPG